MRMVLAPRLALLCKAAPSNPSRHGHKLWHAGFSLSVKREKRESHDCSRSLWTRFISYPGDRQHRLGLNVFEWLSGCEDVDAEIAEELNRAAATPSDSSKMTGKKKNRPKAEFNEVELPPPTGKGDAPRLRLPLVWIDLEMTGLDPDKDRILEIACIITDGKLERLQEGPDLVINQPEELIAGMGEWCTKHHSASGLVAGVRDSSVTEEEAERMVLEFVRQHCPSTGPPPTLAGNSVYVDLIFLKKYMPTLAACFSHILVDVSSVRALCSRWYPKDSCSAPVKKQSHRALDDIKESIAELRYLRQAIFKGPGRR